MSNVSKHKSDVIMIQCPMCSSSREVKKSEFNENKKRKAISFRCTCGNHFHKQIIRKDFKEIDIIAAIARFDFETLWYKIKRVIFFLGGPIDSEKIRLA